MTCSRLSAFADLIRVCESSLLGNRIFGFNQDVFEDSGLEPASEEAAILVRALAAYTYMTELAMSVSHKGVPGRCDDDVEFAFGFDLILDGLERGRA